MLLLGVIVGSAVVVLVIWLLIAINN
jgi:hypothetical protein